MAHKTLIGGTAYDISGGKTLISGTGYSIKGGRTLIGGVGYDVSFGTPPLNDFTWQQIREISDAGLASTYFSVGDTKTITVNGVVNDAGWVNASESISNLSVDVFIIGIDHNSTFEGSNRIHFQIGKIGTTGICLINANNYGFAWNYASTNGSTEGGWGAAPIRTNVLGNAGTPTSLVANSLMAALPADLLAVMKPVTKYTNNTRGTSNSSSAVTATTDYLFLLAEYEIFGKRTCANQYEQNKQAQYDYYKEGNSTIIAPHTNPNSTSWWWSRSPAYSPTNNTGACAVGHDGRATNNGARAYCGVTPGFCV